MISGPAEITRLGTGWPIVPPKGLFVEIVDGKCLPCANLHFKH